jgi:RimJ/RimL family protein N-acetyltransferase
MPIIMISAFRTFKVITIPGNLPKEIRTNRLLLRRWRSADSVRFAEMNADPKVMEYFPALLSRAESDASIQRFEEHFDLRGFGLWAVEALDVAPFIGYVGLRRVPWPAPFTPCVEVGWRLAAQFWGQGFASEAAQAAFQFGFDSLGLDEIVSFTVPANWRSRRVMERIGMVHCPDEDFPHPMLPADHPLSRHVLYRIRTRP